MVKPEGQVAQVFGEFDALDHVFVGDHIFVEIGPHPVFYLALFSPQQLIGRILKKRFQSFERLKTGVGFVLHLNVELQNFLVCLPKFILHLCQFTGYPSNGGFVVFVGPQQGVIFPGDLRFECVDLRPQFGQLTNS